MATDPSMPRTSRFCSEVGADGAAPTSTQTAPWAAPTWPSFWVRGDPAENALIRRENAIHRLVGHAANRGNFVACPSRAGYLDPVRLSPFGAIGCSLVGAPDVSRRVN